jgi:hypothetical protein
LNRLARQAKYNEHRAYNGTYMRQSAHIIKATDGVHTTGPRSDRPSWQRATAEAAKQWEKENPGKRPNIRTIEELIQKLKASPEFSRQYDKAAPARVDYYEWGKMKPSSKQAHAQAVVTVENAKKDRFQDFVERYEKMSPRQQRKARIQAMGEDRPITYREWSARVDAFFTHQETPKTLKAPRKAAPMEKKQTIFKKAKKGNEK